MNLLDKFHSWRRKKRWDKQYRKGRWEEFKTEREAIRYKTIEDFLMKYAVKNPAIFDIGCGDGVLNERMERMEYSYFLGLDFSKESIKRARSKNFPNSHFITEDIVHFTLDQNFDAIVFNEAFYYVHETEKQNVLNRLLGHLNNNGIIITSIYREGTGCWHYFKDDKRLEELDFNTVTTDQELQYWKIGVYRKV